MFDTGNGLIEIFNNGDGLEGQGVIRHFAFAWAFPKIFLRNN